MIDSSDTYNIPTNGRQVLLQNITLDGSNPTDSVTCTTTVTDGTDSISATTNSN